MAFLEDIGRSNMGQSLGNYLSRVQEERRTAMEEKRLGIADRESAARMQGLDVQRNLQQVQLEEVKKLREKRSFEGEFKSTIPYGYDYLHRTAKMMGIIDPEGFATVGGLQKFGEFLAKPENNIQFGKVAFQEAQTKLKELQSLSTAEDGKERMKNMGIKDKDLPALIQKTQQEINMLKTTKDEYEERFKTWNSLGEGFKTFLAGQGVNPNGMDVTTMNARIQEAYPSYQKAVRAEAEQGKARELAKSMFLEEYKAKLKGDAPDKPTEDIRAFEQETGKKYNPSMINELNEWRKQKRTYNAPNPEEVDALASSMAEGKLAPDQISKRGVQQQMVFSAVKKAYPDFDFQKASANYKYTTNSSVLRSAGQAQAAMPRVYDLYGKISNLKNTFDVPLLDEPLNKIKRALGNKAVSDFESLRNAIIQEVNTALSGSATASDYRIKLELENLKSGMTVGQQMASIDNLISALDARKDASTYTVYPWEVVQGKLSTKDWQKREREEATAVRKMKFSGGGGGASGKQYTQEDLEYTAKKHGISVEEVKRKLGVE